MDLECIKHVLVWFHCLRGLVGMVDSGAVAYKISGVRLMTVYPLPTLCFYDRVTNFDFDCGLNRDDCSLIPGGSSSTCPCAFFCALNCIL